MKQCIDHLTPNPEQLLALRPWPELDLLIGECPCCDSTLAIELHPMRRENQEPL